MAINTHKDQLGTPGTLGHQGPPQSVKTAPEIDDEVNGVSESSQGDKRQMDPELRTMGAMLRLLKDLDECARPRVVRWLHDRYLADSREDDRFTTT